VSSIARFTRNISWSYVEMGVAAAIYFLLTPFIVEKLGAIGFGVWTLIHAIVYFLGFLDLGFYNAMVKYIAEFGEQRRWRRVNALLGVNLTALTLAGLMAFLCSLVIAGLAPWFFDLPDASLTEFRWAIVLFGINLLLTFPLSVFSATYAGFQRFDLLSIVRTIINLCRALAIALSLAYGYGLMALVVVYICASLVQASILWLLLSRFAPGVSLAWRRLRGYNYRRIRSYSKWTSLDEVLVEGSAELERLLIAIFLAVALVTPYTLICTVAAVVLFAVEPITKIFFPLSSAYGARNDKAQLRGVLLRGTKLLMSISLPLAVVVAVLGEDFIHFWIGEEHIALPAGVMQLVVANFAVTAAVMTAGTILLAMARVRQVFWMTVSEVLLSLSLMLFLVPAAGLAGFAASLLIANIVLGAFWMLPFLCRQLEQPVLPFFGYAIIRPALAVSPGLLLMLAVQGATESASLITVLIKGAVVGLACLVLLWLFGLKRDEREQLLALVQQLWQRWRPYTENGNS
jgi:O-antigen/teichoic acid export membrane protein